MAYTVPDILLWARISQALAGIGEAKKQYTTGETIDLDLDMKISLTRKDVIYAYEQDPTSDETYQQANFLYALCFPYMLQAQFLDGGSGGSVTPVTPSSRPSPLYFIVADGTFLENGDTSKSIPDFLNYGLIFTRGGVPQSTVVTEPSYFTWNPLTAEFTCSPSIMTGELIGLIPV